MKKAEIIDRLRAEEATGISESPRGIGKFYLSGGHEVNQMEAQDALVRGASVEVPNAGAGSYRRVFEALGCPKVELFESTSSAGDWSFAAFDGEAWYPAFQSNRYPRHGFSYSMNRDIGFCSKEDCFAFMSCPL